MSIPLNVMAALNMPYQHSKFLFCQIRDILGTIETLQLGVEKFFTNFPEDQKNSRYLAKLAHPFYMLENEVDSWEENLANMSEPL